MPARMVMNDGKRVQHVRRQRRAAVREVSARHGQDARHMPGRDPRHDGMRRRDGLEWRHRQPRRDATAAGVGLSDAKSGRDGRSQAGLVSLICTKRGHALVGV